MTTDDYKDINIRYYGHPKYNSKRIIEDDIIEVIIQKLEMVLFTKRGDVIGKPTLGADVEYYLWSTTVPAAKIKRNIEDQIIEFIPELFTIGYYLDIEMYQGTLKDIMVINIQVKGYNVNFIFQ